MNRTRHQILLTVILCALVSGAALAETTFYGSLRSSIDYVTAEDIEALPERDFRSWQISSNNSRFGIRGSDDLGGGLSAIYQIEMGVDLDAARVDRVDAVNLRNSFVGLSGGWGSFLAGRHDTPYKIATSKIDPFRDTLGDANAILGREGNTSYFNNRFDNVLMYRTPETGGFHGALAFSADRDPKDDNLNSINPNDGSSTNDPNADYGLSALGMYKSSNFQVGAAFEQLKSAEGEGTVSAMKAFAMMFTGQREDQTRIKGGLVYEQLDLEDLGGGFWDPSHSNIYVTGSYKTAPFKFSGSFGLAGEVKDAGDGYDAGESGATFFSLGGSRKLGDRTKVWINYAQIDNGMDAHYGLGQVEDNCNYYLPGVGQGARSLSAGIWHRF